ncbi:citrate lyase holo-[acyl-carrier protein] synthase [Gilliamella sp. B3464]|uniref:citrate lyase holo-[acyl-carrier protein] synthase n=1 Tax=unclassified Gilliamella TaxID=2685620 RepID=UPI00226A3947|nr:MULTISPECIES: citrate lyase holo-[acyl-carrier protein] synthase [unclassified Gilliamella]MCX8711216.1 citrate lyase holo-[acyl-carrier protein] synthase [Gilliamella sp. B3468]MCX8750266.1 citrate lyase holo-[acyl-carrier protein] synthase [Gilliamella sp. B3464]
MTNILLKFDDGTPVNLEQMLLAKEQRVEHQRNAIKCYPFPLISLSLVIPGPIKKSTGTKVLFKEAITAIHHLLAKNTLQIIHEEQFCALTGYEAIISVECSSDQLKQLCIEIENNHPLGRLWDIDVIDAKTEQSVSRTQLGHQSRQCLVCQDMAKVCGRSRKHTVDDMLAAIEKMTNDYFNLAT